MQTENVRIASPRQKLLVKTLVRENGIKLGKPLEDLNFTEASKLISYLIQKNRELRGANFVNTKHINTNVDNVKLGLATKLVYNSKIYNVAGLTDTPEIKDKFIDEVLGLYQILQEITEKATQMAVAGDIHA